MSEPSKITLLFASTLAIFATPVAGLLLFGQVSAEAARFITLAALVLALFLLGHKEDGKPSAAEHLTAAIRNAVASWRRLEVRRQRYLGGFIIGVLGVVLFVITMNSSLPLWPALGAPLGLVFISVSIFLSALVHDGLDRDPAPNPNQSATIA